MPTSVSPAVTPVIATLVVTAGVAGAKASRLAPASAKARCAGAAPAAGAAMQTRTIAATSAPMLRRGRCIGRSRIDCAPRERGAHADYGPPARLWTPVSGVGAHEIQADDAVRPRRVPRPAR